MSHFCLSVTALVLAFPLAAPPASASIPNALYRLDTASELARQIKKKRDKVDPEVFAKLAELRNEPALGVLEQATGSLKKARTLAPAYAAFAAWADAEEEQATRARRFLARAAFKAKPREVQRDIVRAMRLFGDPAGPALDRVLNEHSDAACRALACDVLVPRLAASDESDALGLLLVNASLDESLGLTYLSAPGVKLAGFHTLPHKEVLRAALVARQDATATRAISAKLLDPSASTPWKYFCIDLLAVRDTELATDGLVAAFTDPDAGIVLASLEQVVSRRGVSGYADDIRPLIRSKEAAVRRAGVAALGELELTDATVRKEIADLSRSRDIAIRMGAAQALASVRTTEAMDALHGLLVDNAWEVRSEALEQLTRLRKIESVPLLIDRLSEEIGRMREDVYGALRIITGLDLGRRDAAWLNWWSKESETFELPSAEDVRQAEADRAAKLSHNRTKAASIYGVHVYSERVTFVMDVSGSMRLNTGPGVDPTQAADPTKPTRIEFAKEELANIVRHFPDGKLFNLIFFASEVMALDKKLVKMNKSNRQRSHRFIRDQMAIGGTALYPALELAFRDPLLDTIYLISDGAPTEGEITDIAEIRARVRLWNGPRRVRIHGITIGQDSDLLQWLTKDTGGTYTRRD